MLPKIARLGAELPQRSRWTLVMCSLALFAMPTWFVVAQSPEGTSAGAQPGSTKPTADSNSQGPKTTKTDATAHQTIPVAPGKNAGVAPATIEFYPQLSEREETILSQLEMTTSFDFTNESLSGVREAIMERHGFDIHIDQVALEEESITLDATDITIKVNEIPLRSALKLILRRKGLAYIIEDDVLMITTRSEYVSQLLTRTYPVRDLTGGESVDFLTLMDAIQQGVKPGDWRVPLTGQVAYAAAPASAPPAAGGAGGGGSGGAGAAEPDGTISMVPTAGSLVIRQSWEGHEEVLKLLRALRKAKGDPSNQQKANY